MEPVTIDGSQGEGGGQVLRTSLTLSLLTGRPFRIEKVRQNRDNPGLRPQHLTAVRAAAQLGHAEVEGDAVGSRTLTFRPQPYEPRDLDIDIGTAGATALVLHTLHLPLALRATSPVRLTLHGGTFNDKAPSFPFLATTWRAYQAALGLSVAVAMPSAGFYPRGGGQLDAWIEPGTPRAVDWAEPWPLSRVNGVAGTCRLAHNAVAERMRDRAVERLAEHGLRAEVALADWPGSSPGAAIALTAERLGAPAPSTFVALGARGKPAEAVAEDAVAELLAHLRSPGIDPYSADQLLLPLAFAEGRSTFLVSTVTEHLRTNARTIASFLDRAILIREGGDGDGLVVVG